MFLVPKDMIIMKGLYYLSHRSLLLFTLYLILLVEIPYHLYIIYVVFGDVMLILKEFQLINNRIKIR